jgi:hypothetical protein
LYTKLLWLVVGGLAIDLSVSSGTLKLNLKPFCDGSQMTALRFTKQDFLFGYDAAIQILSWAMTFNALPQTDTGNTSSTKAGILYECA